MLVLFVSVLLFAPVHPEEPGDLSLLSFSTASPRALGRSFNLLSGARLPAAESQTDRPSSVGKKHELSAVSSPGMLRGDRSARSLCVSAQTLQVATSETGQQESTSNSQLV